MSPPSLGLLVGAAFGAAFVFANAGEPLPGGVAAVLRVLAVACLAAVAVPALRPSGRDEGGGRPGWFGPRFGLLVVAEFALIFGGIALLRAWNAPEEANVAWIALIVGLHFVALARFWRRDIAVPGVLLTGLGAAGLVMAAVSAREWIPFVSGVLSGVVVLGGSLYGAWRPPPGTRAPGR